MSDESPEKPARGRKPQPAAMAKLSGPDLNSVMRALDIDVIALTEILVPRGYRAEMGRLDAPGIHYNLSGRGRFSIEGGPDRELAPHLLIIVPPNTSFAIEVDGDDPGLEVFSQACWTKEPDGVLRGRVPGRKPEVVQICGFFNASFGPEIGLFRELTEPVIEQFQPLDHVDEKLKEAMSELLRQEVGVGAMTAALLKQVIVALIRRSMSSSSQWIQRFSILADRQVTKAFADMTARPGASHDVASLARTAGLSRSAFMARFAAAVGKPPMVALRDLRMRQAALELSTSAQPVDVVAFNAGYESRSSFVRAFKAAFGTDPSDYRAAARTPKDPHGA